MLDLITSTFNAALLAATQLFITTFLSTNPWFENIQIRMASGNETVLCSANLKSSFVSSLDSLLLSGETITLRYHVDLFLEGGTETVASMEVTHGFRYLQSEQRYYIMLSEEGELEHHGEYQSARQAFARLDGIPITGIDQLDRQSKYILQIKAVLNPVRQDGLAENINQLLLWSSVPPTFRSDPFSIAIRS